MRTNPSRKTNRRLRGEGGQAVVFVVLALSIFLLGAVGFAVDMAQLWFHRQAAQTAADAACTAGAMDLLVDATNHLTTQGGFTAGTAFDCSTHPTYAPCQYAALNGYDGKNTSPGNQVSVSFLNAASAPPGVTAPPSVLLPSTVPPFIRADVLDHVQTFFSGLLSRTGTVDVRAFAVCGLQQAKSPIPIIVLNPTVPHALNVQGTPTVGILGGASRSVQVNSSSTTAVNMGGNAGINLECGGTAFTGSSLGVYGGPATPGTTTAGTCPGTPGPPVTPIPSSFPPSGGGFYPGQTGSWQHATPISDPFATIPAPTIPVPPGPVVPTDADMAGNVSCSTSASILAGTCIVAYHIHGCPDTSGCKLYTRGYYPSGICVGTGGACGGAFTTALFDPGVYYINNGLALKQLSVVRPGTGVGDGSNGTMFYLTGNAQTCSGQTGLICVGSNSGKTTGIDAFTTSGVRCPGPPLGPAPDPTLGLPPTLNGSILLAPCNAPTGGGTNYGDPLGQYRGMLFFQDRALSTGGGWGGGGGFLLAGNMYFHACNSSGTGTSCSTTVCTTIGSCAAGSSFGSSFTLQGGSGSAAYVLGEIITDTLTLAGNSSVNMALNPNAAYNVLKASLLQ